MVTVSIRAVEKRERWSTISSWDFLQYLDLLNCYRHTNKCFPTALVSILLFSVSPKAIFVFFCWNSMINNHRRWISPQFDKIKKCKKSWEQPRTFTPHNEKKYLFLLKQSIRITSVDCIRLSNFQIRPMLAINDSCAPFFIVRYLP